METTQSPKRTGVSFIGAAFGMLITFIGGIYVGAHPSWIPNKWFNHADEMTTPVKPSAAGPTTMPEDHPMAASRPTTAP